MTRRRHIETLIGGTVLLFALACLGLVPLQGTFLLAFGWVSFLFRVVPDVQADWSSAATGALALGLLVGGLHLFLRWLNRSIDASRATDSEPATSDTLAPTRPWRVRWTASIVAIVVMMFVAGVSMVGVIHEVGWLATSPEPIVTSSMHHAVRRMQSSSHLKQMALGMHSYHEVFGVLPGTITSEGGQALSGWQAAILSLLSSADYEHIDTSQAWDSQRNVEALSRPISIYHIPHPSLPKKNAAGYSLSHYSGNVHVLGGPQPLNMSDIRDGTSNTLLIGEAAGNYRPWGHPHNYRDPMLGINKSPDGFGGPWNNGGAMFSMADGSVKYITNDIDPQVLRALATPAGGETVGDY